MLRAAMRSASLLLASVVAFTTVVAACGSDDDPGDAGPSSSSGSGASSSSSSSASSSAASSSSTASSSSASSGGSGGAAAAGGGGAGGVAEGGAGGAGGSLGGAGGSEGGAGGSEGGAGGTGGATFCVPSSTQACYNGPGGTQNIGICKAGAQTCLPDGSAYGACQGEVQPAAAESCAMPTDENCNGQVDEGCNVVTYSGAVQAIFQMKCSPCHNGGGSGNHNIAQSYADTQKASVVCPGLTIGACALVRIQNGSMPFSAGCSGDPVQDAGNPLCLTAAQQQTIQQWIAGGQQP